MNKHILIFFGPPGSGKGTQADMLGKKIGLPVISPGELLRHEQEKRTELGLSLAKTLSQGKLVSDEVIEAVVDKRLKKRDTLKGFVLDGYPRRFSQLQLFNLRLAQKRYSDWPILVLYIKVSDVEIKKRLLGRRVCDCGASYHLKYNPPKQKNICDLCGRKLYRRSDDNPEVVISRLKDYHKRMGKILKYFRQHDMVQDIDGDQSIDTVAKEILTIVKKAIKDDNNQNKRRNKDTARGRKKTR